MKIRYHVGTGCYEDLVATLEIRSSEVVGREIPKLKVRACGAIEYDDALAQGLQKSGHNQARLLSRLPFSVGL